MKVYQKRKRIFGIVSGSKNIFADSRDFIYTFLKVNFNTSVMHICKSLIMAALSLLFLGYGADASFIDNFGGGTGAPTVRFCEGDECGTQQGIEVIKGSLSDIETERSASEYIQDIVQYLLTFITIVAVIYIIYAGFNIMIGNGDEEKLKKSRQTIIYVLLGIIVIFLAWPITLFILRILNVT